MVKPMGLLLSYFFFDHLPSASRFVCFSGCVSAAASKAVVLHSYGVLCLFEGKSNLLSSEYVSIEILAEYLCSFVINFILRIDHDNIFRTNFVEDLADYLRMAGVDED